MNKVNIIDSVGSKLFVAEFKSDHFVEMVNRGWIKEVFDGSVAYLEMSYLDLQQFLNEAA